MGMGTTQTIPYAYTRLAFTGPHDLDYAATMRVSAVIEDVLALLDPDRIIVASGLAYGVDTLAIRMARKRGFATLGFAPKGAWHNVNLRSYCDTVIEVEGDYMTRNDAVVEWCERLVAIPRLPDEVRRSGTWATVRRARRLKRVVDVLPYSAPAAEAGP